jgi:hypothetical protein
MLLGFAYARIRVISDSRYASPEGRALTVWISNRSPSDFRNKLAR